MKLINQTKLHFKQGKSDKVYEVDLCEINRMFVVNFRYGRRGSTLREGTKTTTPVIREKAESLFQKLVNDKKKKGYRVIGDEGESVEKPKIKVSKDIDEKARNSAILAKLQNSDAKKNPKIERIIWRAGELKLKEATPYLIDLIGTGKDLRDYCIAWSLGFCGDETAISTLEALGKHKAEFVRRISNEAIAKLGDDVIKNRLKEEAVSNLPQVLQNLSKFGTSESFEKSLRDEIENQKKGSFDVLTEIYRVDNEITRPILLKILNEIPLKPNYFRPIRHIFKMAEYRRDAETFGIISRRFEKEKAGFTVSPWWDRIYLRDDDGNWETLKVKEELSKKDSRLAYSNKTKEYFSRRTWRTLRKLGELGSLEYVEMAVGSLLAYTDADAQAPRKSVFYNYYDENGNWDWRNPRLTEIHWDKFSPYLLLNHILYGNSPRYEYLMSSRGFRCKENYKIGGPIPKVREESFPELWEKQPVGLLHLLSESECTPVHEFAVKVLRDCQEFTDNLDVEAIVMLLSRPYEATATLGFELAKSKYDSANPDVELVLAVATCSNSEARQEAFGWIDFKRELFAKDNSSILKLITCEHQDTRKFASTVMQSTVYSESEAKHLIAVLISELVNLDETKNEIAKDLSEAILQSFGKELRTLNLDTIKDLLKHNLLEVQKAGGNILLNHATSADELPNNLIKSLIESEFEEMRAIGIKLFGQLSDENLLNRETVIMSLLSHELIDVHNSTRPIVLRLAAKYEGFVANISNSILIALLLKEKHEGVHGRLLGVLKELPNWEKPADLETARMLVSSDKSMANEAGGLILQARAEEWKNDFSTAEIVEFTNHEVLSIRQTSWKLAEITVEKLRSEVSYLIRALDAKWQDSRKFWREFYRTEFDSEMTPKILVAICDSVVEETQKFGRDLLLKYFKEEDGVEYLLKLSEHPTPEMQLFATNYLETYASGSPEKIDKLSSYFIRVLSLVNRSRVAKDRVLQFLETEALRDAESAKVVSKIFTRQSATVAIGDKSKMIQSMLKIHQSFPEIELPLKINKTEVRENAV